MLGHIGSGGFKKSIDLESIKLKIVGLCNLKYFLLEHQNSLLCVK